jgi:transcriptional regulator with XRE-family HTH domain
LAKHLRIRLVLPRQVLITMQETNHIVANIGSQIKEIRKQKGLTIQDIVDITNISKGMLSKIENGRTIPTLQSLIAITQALEIDLSLFFDNLESSRPEDVVIRKPADYVHIEKENAFGFLYQLIISRRVENIVFEAVLLELEPDCKRAKVVTDGLEFKLVLEGEVEYHIGDKVYHLQQGDSIYFDGRIPHVPVNPSGQITKMLVIYLMENK